MERSISLIIPIYNGSRTIEQCLEAAFGAHYGNYEVIVVDDCSTDSSRKLCERFPCRVIAREKKSGAGSARNAGAAASTGEILFFIDADCMIEPGALALANKAVAAHPGVVIGGTYTRLPADPDFFSKFQSLFIHYSETRRQEPDYIASHAMIIEADLFRSSGGFPENFYPILEDVEFSHRLRRAGVRLLMKPEIQVVHMFNFTLARSLKNAFRKSRYWTRYSLSNKDVFSDSGTASLELKGAVLGFLLSALFAVVAGILRDPRWLIPVPAIVGAVLFQSRKLFQLMYRAQGAIFLVKAACYYAFLYPAVVAAGAAAGVLHYGFRPDSKH